MGYRAVIFSRDTTGCALINKPIYGHCEFLKEDFTQIPGIHSFLNEESGDDALDA